MLLSKQINVLVPSPLLDLILIPKRSRDLCEHGSNHSCGNARPRSSARHEVEFRQSLFATALACRDRYSMHGADDRGAGFAHVYKGGGHQVSRLDRLYV